MVYKETLLAITNCRAVGAPQKGRASIHWLRRCVAAEGEQMSTAIGQRRTLASRWLSIASSSGVNPQKTLEERELARRSDLLAWLALGMLGGLVVVSPIAIGDPVAALAYLCFFALIIAAIFFNRGGRITLGGIVLVISLNAAVFVYMWSSPLGLTMGQLPNYDALVVSVVLAASVLPRQSAFVVAALNAGCIVADYLLRPHNANVAADAALYPSPTIQTISLLVRPIALQFVMALVAFLWVRSTDQAIRRADRAEEIALLEYRELERTKTLEEGVRYLHQTLAQWAQGNFTGRVPLMPLGVLEQVRNDLNAYMERFGPMIDASYYLRWLQQDVARLTAALEMWTRGQPVIWPETTGSPLDRAVELLRFYGAGVPRPSRPSGPPASSRPTGAPHSASGPRPTGAPYIQSMSNVPNMPNMPNMPDLSDPIREGYPFGSAQGWRPSQTPPGADDPPGSAQPQGDR